MANTNTSTLTPAALDQLSINTLRFLSVDAVQQADSGHPGLPLGAAPMAYTLWDRFLRHNPADPHWFNRDRFVLSAGHGSALLYSLLHMTGYDLPMEQIRQFRQWHSMTPGHPERGIAPGVEVTTGPLGQGFANGVGIAMAEAYLAARYNRPGYEIINHHTYALVSDGDMMEGVAAEAAPLAGHLKLGKLIYLYDDNRITLAASTPVTFTENHVERFNAYGWHTQVISDGNDVEAIDKAIRAAQAEASRPSLILVRTHIGYGSPKQDSFKAHGSPLGAEDVKKTKEKLGWPVEPAFLVPEEAKTHMNKALDRGAAAETAWKNMYAEYSKKYPDLAAELTQLISGKLPDGWDAKITPFAADAKGIATRAASGQVMQAIAAALPAFIGGSADLNSSTHTELKGLGNFGDPSIAEGQDMQGSAEGGWSFAGRNLQYGVREHAMGAISNGLAAHGGILPFCSTFFIFSDYMRPPMRLAAIMELKVVYVFTHDSIAVGEDGTTHQPVEQLAGLRAVPDLVVIRPADANETAEAWRVAISLPKRPVALVLTRQNLPILDRTAYAAASGLDRGAYILSDAPDGKPEIILMASGSEVSLIVAAAMALRAKNIAVRLVSVPSWELFDAQGKEYRDKVLPPSVHARLAVEAGSPLGWERYTGDNGDILGIEKFGSSAPGDTMMREYGFTPENVCKRALALLGKK